jgi:hypothetical protein
VTEQHSRSPEPYSTTDDEATSPEGEPVGSGHIEYGGGRQEGGGMVEPEEFPDGGTNVLEEPLPEGVPENPNAEAPR